MANLNIKLLMIIFSIIAVVLVAGFGIWMAIRARFKNSKSRVLRPAKKN